MAHLQLTLYYLRWSVFGFLIAIVGGYQSYQKVIPNGNRVPHPCDPTTTWPGVGHKAPQGAGVRNQFGVDFAGNLFVWTVSFCKLDSDGDGKTNGAELGDPLCVWLPGSQPAVTNSSQLTHPGVCEPISSSLCNSYNTFLHNISVCAGQMPKSNAVSNFNDSLLSTIVASWMVALLSNF